MIRRLILAALAAFSLSALAQTVPLGSCSSWSIVGNVFTCAGTTPAGNAPTCGVNITPPTGPAGSTVTVVATCSNSPTRYTWSGGFMQGQPGASASGTVASSQLFTVTASNAAGSSTASGTFTVSGSSGSTCQGSLTLDVTAQPGTVSRFYSSNAGSFGNATTLVVRFNSGGRSGFGKLTLAEFGGQTAPRLAVLSPAACDFGAQPSAQATQRATTITLNFSVGPNAWGYPALAPNTTYYLNVKNDANGTPTCGDASCDVFVDFTLPR